MLIYLSGDDLSPKSEPMLITAVFAAERLNDFGTKKPRDDPFLTHLG